MTGDLFTDFLQQIPVGLIIQVCLAGILLVAAVMYFRVRNKRKTNSSPTNHADSESTEDAISSAAAIMHDALSAPPVESVLSAHPRIDTGQLPDLDMLLDSRLPEVPPPTAPPLVPDEPPQHISETGTYTLNLHSGQTTTAKEVLTILRDTNDDRLIVQIGDTAYRTLVNTPDMRKEFTQIMRELSNSVTKPDTLEVTTPGAEVPVPELSISELRIPEPDILEDSMPELSISELRIPEPTTDAPPAEARSKPVAEHDVPNLRDLFDSEPLVEASPPPPISPEGDMPGDLPSFRLDDHPVEYKKRGLLGRKKIESAPVPELDIAASIEAYLQHKLRHTPEHAGREIHVHSAPGGGVRIQVDQLFYDAVGDVEDTVIREFMAATIQEWQDRQ